MFYILKKVLVINMYEIPSQLVIYEEQHMSNYNGRLYGFRDYNRTLNNNDIKDFPNFSKGIGYFIEPNSCESPMLKELNNVEKYNKNDRNTPDCREVIVIVSNGNEPLIIQNGPMKGQVATHKKSGNIVMKPIKFYITYSVLDALEKNSFTVDDIALNQESMLYIFREMKIDRLFKLVIILKTNMNCCLYHQNNTNMLTSNKESLENYLLHKNLGCKSCAFNILINIVLYLKSLQT